jgi:hypothetical protein
MQTRLALLLPLLALAACTADNNASVKVSAICAPPDDPTNCVFQSTCDAQTLDRNVLDVALTPAQGGNRLWMFVQVDNQLPANGNAGDFRSNTNDAYAQEIEVEYPGTGLPTATAPILGSAVVPADGAAVISVTPIPESIGNILQTAGVVPAGASIEGFAKMRLKGVLGDTTKFETGAFQIPIRVCRGCLLPTIVFPTLTCAAGDVPLSCPPNSFAQTPASSKCVTP